MNVTDTYAEPMEARAPKDPLLAEEIAYYRAVAPEYESHSLPGWSGPEVAAALEAFEPKGALKVDVEQLFPERSPIEESSAGYP